MLEFLLGIHRIKIKEISAYSLDILSGKWLKKILTATAYVMVFTLLRTPCGYQWFTVFYIEGLTISSRIICEYFLKIYIQISWSTQGLTMVVTALIGESNRWY